MKNKDDVYEIFKNGKLIFKELNLNRDLFYLIDKSYIRHWEYLYSNHIIGEWWNNLYEEFWMNIKDSYSSTLYKRLKVENNFNLLPLEFNELCDHDLEPRSLNFREFEYYDISTFNFHELKISYGMSYFRSWRPKKEDREIRVGSIVLLIDNELKLHSEIEVSTFTNVSDVNYFINGEWVKRFQEFIKKLRNFEDQVRVEFMKYGTIKHPDTLKYLEIEFSKSDNDINDSYYKVLNKETYLFNMKNFDWDYTLNILRENFDEIEVVKIIENTVQTFIDEKSNVLVLSSLNEIMEIWHQTNLLVQQLQNFLVLSSYFIAQLNKNFDNHINLKFHHSIKRKFLKTFYSDLKKNEILKKIKDEYSFKYKLMDDLYK